MATGTTPSDPALHDLVLAGVLEQGAVAVNDHIYLSRGTSSSALVTTADGDVVINTGMPHEGAVNRTRFRQVSRGPVRVIVFTQSHPDHIGGWSAFDGPGVETIAQSNYQEVRGYWTRLGPFYTARGTGLWARTLAAQPGFARMEVPDPTPTLTFDDHHELALGGRRFELLSVPGGETTDSLVVWLPDEATAFVGNLMGPMIGHIPNLSTIRGDKLRSASAFIRSLDRVRSLDAELLISGHGEPLRGRELIATTLTGVRDAVQWVHDRTVDGMNAGDDLFSLMRSIQLPPNLAVGEGHGKVSWCVRAVWEEYAGWFRWESTTELYALPQRAIWPELAELAGGSEVLAARARAHVEGGRPLEGLHFAELAVAADPASRAARAARLAAHELLLERSGRANLSESRWIENQIADDQAALAGAPTSAGAP